MNFQFHIDMIMGEDGEEFRQYCLDKGLLEEEVDTLFSLLYAIDDGNDI